MATRDRTPIFLRYREQARQLHRFAPSHSNSFDNNSPPANSDFQVFDIHQHEDDPYEPLHTTRGGMQPDWIFEYNDLKGDVADLADLLEKLAALYAQHLLPSFGEKDTSQLEHDIRGLSHRLTEMLHTVERKVRRVAARRAQPSVDGNERDVELEIRRNIQKRFAMPLQELSISFRKRQKEYFDKLREMRETYTEAKGPSAGTASNALLDNDDQVPNEYEDSAFSETQLLTVESASSLAQERTQELNRVAANINDLAVIVKDIASLVVDQGTVLDRIDYNLEEVKSTTFAAVRELRIADRYQRKRHAVCCILILAIACGIMFIVLVYKWTS